jgi:hypothetical protein
MDGAGGDAVLYDIPVFGAAAGELASPDDEGASIIEDAFFPAEGVLYQFFGAELITKVACELNANLGQSMSRKGNSGRY